MDTVLSIKCYVEFYQKSDIAILLLFCLKLVSRKPIPVVLELTENMYTLDSLCGCCSNNQSVFNCIIFSRLRGRYLPIHCGIQKQPPRYPTIFFFVKLY